VQQRVRQQEQRLASVRLPSSVQQLSSARQLSSLAWPLVRRLVQQRLAQRLVRRQLVLAPVQRLA
jgi:hypothetical protein